MLREVKLSKLRGKNAIVTGGSKGIGLAVATRHAGEGAPVAIVSRKQDACGAAADAINAAGGKAFGIACDVGDLDQHQVLIDAVVERAGKKPGEVKAELDRTVPFGRFGVVEDMTGTAVFLASDDSEDMSAQILNVGDGRVPG